MISAGSTRMLMHGPVKGVSRRMTRSEQMCEGVCPDVDNASGWVNQLFVAACALRVFVTSPQFLHVSGHKM